MRQLIMVLSIAVAMGAQAQADRQYIREGNHQYRQRHYAAAEVSYTKAVSKNQNNSQALYNLGCALMMQQKDSAALAMYNKAVHVEKNKLRLAKAFHNMGVILQAHGQYDQAVTAYEHSLRNNPKDDETRYNLAMCKRHKKDSPQQNNQKQQQKNDEDQQGADNQKEEKSQNEQSGQQKQSPQNRQISKEDAERLLNAAVQNEKNTQQRLRKAMQQPQRKTLQKNW